MSLETLHWGHDPSGLRQAPLAFRPILRQLQDLKLGELQIAFDNGPALRFRGPDNGPIGRIEIRAANRLARRVAWRGDLGLAEGYIGHDWDTPDLPSLLLLLSLNLSALDKADARHPLMWLLERLRHALNRNSMRGSRRNIAAHYDLGNDFYAQWLDPSMTYSSACFDQSHDLTEAQTRKYERLLDLIDPAPGEHILEIGCGWGGFAEYAARWGMQVTGITLSKEQLAYAEARIARAGLSDRVTFKLCDYRELRGTYDHAVSVEMLEAVGQRYWGRYFQTLYDHVRPGGRIALQAITIDEGEFDDYVANAGGFIQKYIFPGGMLLTTRHLFDLAAEAKLDAWHLTPFGKDYATTLHHWLERFDAVTPWLEANGYDDAFRRTWRYYLAFCEAGFRDGRIDVVHFSAERP